MLNSVSRLTSLALLVLTVIFYPMGAVADGYADDWGPAVGSQLPVLDAPDQAGVQQNLRSLTGKQGLLLFMNRSADW